MTRQTVKMTACKTALIMGNLMDGLVKLPAEQQALISMKVSAVLGLISAVFNLCCGWYGLKKMFW